MSGRRGQLRAAATLDRVADVVRFKRQCGFSWKRIAHQLGLSPRQAQRYMSRNKGYMSHKSGGQEPAEPLTI